MSSEETSRALQTAKEAGVLLQVGFNRRMDPNFRKLKQLVQAGELGRPHIVKITSRDPQPPGEAYVRSSGGMFMDMTIHDFDMARYLVGEEVAEVYTRGANLIDPMFGRCDDVDTAVITLTFTNGAICVIDNSRQAVYGYDQRVEVFGSQGAATADNCRPTTVEVSTASSVTRDQPLHFSLSATIRRSPMRLRHSPNPSFCRSRLCAAAMTDSRPSSLLRRLWNRTGPGSR